jgi:hypothetical protein
MLFQGALVDRGSPERPAAYYLVDKAGLAGSGRALEKAIAGGRGPFENVCPWARDSEIIDAGPLQTTWSRLRQTTWSPGEGAVLLAFRHIGSATVVRATIFLDIVRVRTVQKRVELAANSGITRCGDPAKAAPAPRAAARIAPVTSATARRRAASDGGMNR